MAIKKPNQTQSDMGPPLTWLSWPYALPVTSQATNAMKKKKETESGQADAGRSNLDCPREAFLRYLLVAHALVSRRRLLRESDSRHRFVRLRGSIRSANSDVLYELWGHGRSPKEQ